MAVPLSIAELAISCRASFAVNGVRLQRSAYRRRALHCWLYGRGSGVVVCRYPERATVQCDGDAQLFFRVHRRHHASVWIASHVDSSYAGADPDRVHMGIRRAVALRLLRYKHDCHRRRGQRYHGAHLARRYGDGGICADPAESGYGRNGNARALNWAATKWPAVLLIILALAGCAPPVTPPTPPAVNQHMAITWTSDGNPQAVQCGATLRNCIASIQILDQTTGATYSVPVIQMRYVATGAKDAFAIRVTGYDNNGSPITSTYQAVLVAQ